MLKPQRKCCKHCKTRFTTAKPEKIYCSTNCRVKGNRLVKQRVEFHKTAFGEWLIRKCKSSQTVQVLTDTNLSELYCLWKYRKKVDGFGNSDTDPKKRFELSHIAPATHPEIIGTLHPFNLVVAPGSYNRTRYNAWDGVSGRWILISQLETRWDVSKAERVESVSKKIASFCGDDFKLLLSEFKLQLSSRQKMLEQLISQDIGTKQALGKLSYEQLEELCKANPVYPKRSAMVKQLLNRPLSAPPEHELGCMSDIDILGLYTLLIQPKQHSLTRATNYQVYAHEAERLGLSQSDYSCYYENELEHLDYLHGAPLTVEYALTSDNDYRNYY